MNEPISSCCNGQEKQKTLTVNAGGQCPWCSFQYSIKACNISTLAEQPKQDWESTTKKNYETTTADIQTILEQRISLADKAILHDFISRIRKEAIEEERKHFIDLGFEELDKAEQRGIKQGAEAALEAVKLNRYHAPHSNEDYETGYNSACEDVELHKAAFRKQYGLRERKK